MEIVSRKDARERGLKKYFTGGECANGHVAERYVGSGGCSVCIRAANAKSTTAEAPLSEAMKKECVEVKLGVYQDQHDQLRQAVGLFNSLRWPDAPLRQREWTRHTVENYGGVRMAMYRLHVADVPAIRALQDELQRQHKAAAGFDIAREVARIAGRAAQFDSPDDNVPTISTR